MASYYRKIKGINYDRKLLDLAESSTKGQGDGRISINDAKKLIKAAKDSDTYTETEKRTVQYIRDNYKFTKEADSFFRGEIRKWAAGKAAVKKAAVKKGAVKKGAVKKAAVKKAAVKKGAVKKGAVKKAAVKKTPAKKAVKKTAPAKQKTETGFMPSFSEMPAQEGKPSEAAQMKQADDKGTSVKPFLVVVVLAVLAFLVFAVYPKLKKNISLEKDTSVKEQGSGAAEGDTGKKGDEKSAGLEEKSPDMKNGKIEKTGPGKGTAVKAPEVEESSLYTVQVKDQLTEISFKKYGNYHDWKLIYNANRDKISDPRLIFPGQKLVIPEKK